MTLSREPASLLEIVGWALVHSSWQFVLIALAAQGVSHLLGRHAATVRSSLFIISFAACAIVPVATGCLIAGAGRLAATSANPTIAGANESDRGVPLAVRGPADGQSPPANGAALSEFLVGHHQALSARGITAETTGVRALQSRFEQFCRPWLPYIVVLWFLGACGFALRPLTGLLTLTQLRVRGASAVSREVEMLLHGLTQRLAVSPTVAVVQSTLVRIPMVVGWFRPVILLPVSILAELPLPQIEAILAHELAHITRNDFLTNALQTLVETLYFYHPSVWWLSNQIRDERENCCDDLAVATLGSQLDYGRALVAIEHLRGTAPALALGAQSGTILARIERLLQPCPSRPSWGVTPPLLAMCFLLFAAALAAGGWQGSVPARTSRLQPAQPAESAAPPATKSESTQPPAQPADSSDPASQPEVVNPSPRIIIAENVILWDRRIVTWDEVIERLRKLRRKLGVPIHPSFYFTNAAHKAELFDKYHAAVFEVYRELFEPAGVTFGSISPRAGPRYDAITEPADLEAKPELARRGVVRDRGDQPVSGATVVLIPEEALMPVMLTAELLLRDPHDEVWTLTDADGVFSIEAPQTGFRIAVISPDGFALTETPPVDDPVEVTLEPLVSLTLQGARGTTQKLDLTIHLAGLPNTAASLSMYGIELKKELADLELPPGTMTVSRSFDQGNGSAVSVPAETLTLSAGQKKLLKLPPRTLDELRSK